MTRLTRSEAAAKTDVKIAVGDALTGPSTGGEGVLELDATRQFGVSLSRVLRNLLA